MGQSLTALASICMVSTKDHMNRSGGHCAYVRESTNTYTLNIRHHLYSTVKLSLPHTHTQNNRAMYILAVVFPVMLLLFLVAKKSHIKIFSYQLHWKFTRCWSMKWHMHYKQRACIMFVSYSPVDWSSYCCSNLLHLWIISLTNKCTTVSNCNIVLPNNKSIFIKTF